MRKQSFCLGVLTCLLALFLSSCGGSSVGEGFGQIIACGFMNCTNSGTMSLGDINAFYVVTQSGSELHVAASLGRTANLLTVVQLSDGDSLTASVGNQSATLTPFGSPISSYTADFSDGDVQPTVTVNFNRGGTNYPGTVTMPRQFTLIAPLPPTSVTRTMGSFTVDLGIASDWLLTANLNAQCTRLDGTSFSSANSSILNYGGGGAVSGGISIQVDTNTLDAALNSIGQSINSPTVNTSLVANCDVQITWTQTQIGQVSSSLYKNSTILGQTSAVENLHYDAQRQ